MSQSTQPAIDECQLVSERQRLIRLCARLTGDPTSAEDLAHETLVEAWRHADRLKNPDARQAWLSGIARNVCRRWARDRGRDLQHTLQPDSDRPAGALDWQADGVDIELELERDELATLLDRALAHLPPETRLALIEHYVHDHPQAVVAARLGLSQGAVAMRLSRGKLALRRILATELRDDAIAHDLFEVNRTTWDPTSIWCPVCGEQHLVGWFDPLEGTLMLRCPSCYPTYGLHQVRSRRQPYIYTGVHRLRAAYRRMLVYCEAYYQPALTENRAVCHVCGGVATVHPSLPAEELPRLRAWRGAHISCPACDERVHASLDGLLLSLPPARQFWQQEQRIRTLPESEIEVDGRPALVTRFESVTSRVTLDVVADAATLVPRDVYRNGRHRPAR